jgi:hypothetical protein
VSDSSRPSGLTALAVINLLWGGFATLVAFLMFGAPALAAMLARNEDAEARETGAKMEQALTDLGALWYVVIGVAILSGLLLLVSGFGYLKQKKFLGRTLGNAWAIVSITNSSAQAVMVAEAVGGGFRFGTIIGFVYPVLTLLLINGTFKEDFVH